MAQLPIVAHGSAAAIVLPDSLLESLGLRIGDMVNVSVEQQRVTMQADDDSKRRHFFQQAFSGHRLYLSIQASPLSLP